MSTTMYNVIRLLVCAHCAARVVLTSFRSLEAYEYFEYTGMCQACQDQM